MPGEEWWKCLYVIFNGALYLKSNVNFYISQGATIRGSQNEQPALFYLEHNVSIT